MKDDIARRRTENALHKLSGPVTRQATSVDTLLVVCVQLSRTLSPDAQRTEANRQPTMLDLLSRATVQSLEAVCQSAAIFSAL